MDRRLTVCILAVLLIFFLFSCDTSLVNDVREKVTQDRIESGEIPSWTVSYFGNGNTDGSAPADEIKYVEGAAAVVKSNIGDLVKTGHVFKGWNTSVDGSGTSYSTGDSITIAGADIRLYALWQADTYTITFDRNDSAAAGTMPNQQMVYGTSVYLAACRFFKTDHTFMGWATTASGSVVYKDESSFTIGASDITLYAVWKEGISISFEKGYDGAATVGDVVEMDFMVVSKSSTNALDLCAFTRTGYSFKGWDRNEDGSYDYNDGDAYTIGSLPVVLIAVWEANSYNVTLDPDGGSGETVEIAAVFDSAMPDEDSSGNNLSVPSRTGYSFTGYYSQKNGAGYKYYDSAVSGVTSWNIADEATLYAGWNANTYSVTLDKDGGSEGTSSVTAEYDAPLPSAAPPSKNGYIFCGYYSGLEGEGTQYYDQDMKPVSVWESDSSGIIYACWNAVHCNVLLYSELFLEGWIFVDVAYGESFPTEDADGHALVVPEHPGYTFWGYTQEADGFGYIYYDENMAPTGCIWYGTEDAIIYAWWDAAVYEVVLSDPSGFASATKVNTTLEQLLPYFDVYGSRLNVPEYYGYDFMGYFENENGQGVQYYDENMEPVNTWSNENSGTIFAYWEAAQTLVYLEDPYGFASTDTVTGTYGEYLPNQNIHGSMLMIPERSGYNFIGYFMNEYGQGTRYYDQDMSPVAVWYLPVDGILYAEWEPVYYEVVLSDPLGYSGETAVSVICGEFLPDEDINGSMLQAPIFTGCDFMGYYEAENGRGRQYYDSGMNPISSWDFESNGTIYAYWQPSSYEVILTDPQGLVVETSVRAVYGELMPYEDINGSTLQTPNFPGFTFMGYYEEENGQGQQYYDLGMNPVASWEQLIGGTLYVWWQ